MSGVSGSKICSLPWLRSGFLGPTFITVEGMFLGWDMMIRGGISRLSRRFPIGHPNLNILSFFMANVTTGN
jgi:hypothetical protein